MRKLIDHTINGVFRVKSVSQLQVYQRQILVKESECVLRSKVESHVSCSNAVKNGMKLNAFVVN